MRSRLSSTDRLRHFCPFRPAYRLCQQIGDGAHQLFARQVFFLNDHGGTGLLQLHRVEILMVLCHIGAGDEHSSAAHGLQLGQRQRTGHG